ncbi:PREDICTED: uncharacterized protein LOC109289026 isoform X2 [Gavialis gangeticus]|uniref:uncharacterized protein LOC109289026 isoform X1 n=1 Tax=Gavialis gangeticus TaxID=94835 RepID=UPI00092FA94E|nr:PREDICTED: uncharacterized protein LOC109289026 isoform X1 [Gavialis gangeticus]XP_019360430.1 PREDICTED: uncharacterized protein LOC109289026 isoform X2 [Gavialis gangeticus]
MGEAGAGSLGPGQRRRRKLVLHVDVNNTVVVADAVTGQGPRAALNAFLSAAAWGRRAPDGAWQWLSEVPSLRPPCPGAVSYSSAHGRDPHFADSPQGSRFQGVLRQHLRLLAWPGAPHEGLSVRGEGGRRYHLVLPAFLRLLDTLHRDGRRFAVVFRTFGTDLPCVLRALRCALQGQHPGFPALRGLPLPVDASVGRIRCSEQEVVLCRGHTRLSTQDNARALYSFFSAAEGLSGFQDHFDWWARNHFSCQGGKPLWIDPHDPDVHHICIDDNIRLDDSDTIVCPQVFSEPGGSCLRLAPTSELYGVCLVQTDLLEAIADEDYFLRCVRQCEENYERYLASAGSQL